MWHKHNKYHFKTFGHFITGDVTGRSGAVDKHRGGKVMGNDNTNTKKKNVFEMDEEG